MGNNTGSVVVHVQHCIFHLAVFTVCCVRSPLACSGSLETGTTTPAFYPGQPLFINVYRLQSNIFLSARVSNPTVRLVMSSAVSVLGERCGPVSAIAQPTLTAAGSVCCGVPAHKNYKNEMVSRC